MIFQKLGNSLCTGFVIFNLAKSPLCVSDGNFNYIFLKGYIDNLNGNRNLAFSSVLI